MMNRVIGGFWIQVRAARSVNGEMISICDLDWFVFNKDPEDGGVVLASGSTRHAKDEKDADVQVRREMVEALCRLTKERRAEEWERILSN